MSSIALKLTSLAVRTLAKPIATQIKYQAKEHAKFRHVCIAIAQQLHRIDIRLRLSILRDDTAVQKEELAAEAAARKEKKEKEAVSASQKTSSISSAISTPSSSKTSLSDPTASKHILDQTSKKLQEIETASSTFSETPSTSSSSSSQSLSTSSDRSSSKVSSSSSKSTTSGSSTPSSHPKKRSTPHIRPLSDVKAIERGATFISEAFLFAVAGGLILFEAVRSRRKESNRRDIVAERLQTLEEVDEVWRKKVEILERRLDMAGVKRIPERLSIESALGAKNPDDGDDAEDRGGSTASSSWWWKRGSQSQEPIKSVHERTATTPLEKYIKHEQDVKKYHEEEVEAKALGLPVRHGKDKDSKSSPNEDLQTKGKELAVVVNKPVPDLSSSAAKKA